MRIKLPPIARQSLFYFLFGLVQIGIDWVAFVACTALGLSVLPANLIGRVCGALFGFWANGKVTFSSGGTTIGLKQFVRFAFLWSMTAAASTAAVCVLDDHAGLKVAWLAKPFVDLSLSALSFFISRHWIYRR